MKNKYNDDSFIDDNRKKKDQYKKANWRSCGCCIKWRELEYGEKYNHFKNSDKKYKHKYRHFNKRLLK